MSRIDLEKKAGITVVTLKRPEARNALDDALRLEALYGYSSFGSKEELQTALGEKGGKKP